MISFFNGLIDIFKLSDLCYAVLQIEVPRLALPSVCSTDHDRGSQWKHLVGLLALCSLRQKTTPFINNTSQLDKAPSMSYQLQIQLVLYLQVLKTMRAARCVVINEQR